jgi:4-hydroxybenzoate polyprenyltransferase
LFPPFFAGKLSDSSIWPAALSSIVAFSCAASCGYIINDIKDRAADRGHTLKKDRPLAKGDVSVSFAVTLGVLLYIAALLIGSNGVSRRFELYVLVYLFISLIYSFYLKDAVIADMFFISFGFLIRVTAGGEAFGTPVSGWLFLAVFTLSLLLAAGKRLGELVALGDEAGNHRKSLTHYSAAYLEGVLWFTSSSSLVMYALYAMEHRQGLVYTVPISAYGLLRYIYIVKQGRGDPTEALLRDRQIMTVGLAWFGLIGVILY